MCESNVYLRTDQGDQLLLPEVVSIRPGAGGWELIGLFGERKTVAGDLEEIDLLGHRVVIREKK